MLGMQVFSGLIYFKNVFLMLNIFNLFGRLILIFFGVKEQLFIKNILMYFKLVCRKIVYRDFVLIM